jgi:hypothetical protein
MSSALSALKLREPAILDEMSFSIPHEGMKLRDHEEPQGNLCIFCT